MTGMHLTRRIVGDRADLKQVTTLVVIGAVILAGLAGIAAFALSFRPSHFALPPGHVLVYKLTTTSTEIAADRREGRPVTDEQVIMLIGTAHDNEVALLAEEARGRDRLSRHRIESDGSATTIDAAGRPAGTSRAIGIFDLNLFALPPSAAEQAWDASVTYGVLPAGKQLVQARARRSQSKANPEFQLRLPGSLEWPAGGTYRQIRDLVATYRFRTGLGAVDQGRITCTWSVEQLPPATQRRWRIETNIELMDADGMDEDPVRLHDLVRDCAAAGEALGDPAIGGERRRALAADLRTASTGIARLRRLADRLAQEVLRVPAISAESAAKPAGRRYRIQTGIGPESQRAQAEQFARTLIASGFTAQVEPAAAGRLRVVVGPFADKDPEILARLERAFPYIKPLWIEVAP